MKLKTLTRSVAFLYAITIFFVIVLALLGDRAIVASVENAPITDRNIVIIDAGHGGIDTGTTSVTGRPESHINLEIATVLRDLLHLLGIKTKMIRTDDISVYTEEGTIAEKKISDLKERVRIINDTANAVLISIHQNYFQDNRYSGGQVFYGPSQGSQAFASYMQNSIKTNLDPGNRRQAKSASGIYIMQHIRCPGVLIECGFLSNLVEALQLESKVYQQKLCCTIAGAYVQYLNHNSIT